MIPVIDPGYLTLTSPITGGKLIHLQMAQCIAPCLVVDDASGLFTWAHGR